LKANEQAADTEIYISLDYTCDSRYLDGNNRIKEYLETDIDGFRSVNVYMATYVVIFVCSVLLVSFEGEDIVTTVTSVITCINNIGPGLNKLGPTCNFSFLSNFTKVVLMFDMLAGRLELFPLIILFHPKMLKELISVKRTNHSAK